MPFEPHTNDGKTDKWRPDAAFLVQRNIACITTFVPPRHAGSVFPARILEVFHPTKIQVDFFFFRFVQISSVLST